MNEPPKPFAGELMTCCVCGASAPSGQSAEPTGWRVIEVDRVRHYACPAEFPPDGSSAGQFELAYKRVLKVILERHAPEANKTDAPHPTNEAPAPRRCRKCGCTEERACVTDGVPCHWVLPDLCSACAPEALNDRDVRHLGRVEFGLRLTGAEAFALLAALQLALRHPAYPSGPSKGAVVAVAQLLQAQVSVTENLAAVAAAGWGAGPAAQGEAVGG